jgi:hypothetical protein
MEWIKKNYDQFFLLLAALALVGVSVLLIQNANGFGERFASALEPGRPQKNVPPLELAPVDEAKARLEGPALWKPTPDTAFFLVPQRYIIDSVKKVPVQLAQGAAIDSVTGQPIPFQWFIDNKLDPLSTTVTMEDTDKDGYVNEEEWRYKTNPQDVASHPPHLAKLFFKQFIKQQFRLKFQSYTGNPKKEKKEKIDLQINPLDVRGATQFKKVGEPIAGTDYKILDFEFKEVPNPGTGGTKDVSEVTVENVLTNERVVLPLEKIVESPESIGVFDYIWPNPPVALHFKRGQTFTLEPDKATKYKLVDIKETEAVIALPSGEQMTVKPRPQK